VIGEPLICQQCERAFKRQAATGPRPKFCSGACRQRALRLRNRDNVMPPRFWAECPTCHLAYAYVRRLSMSRGWMWVWERECKHRSDPVIHQEAS
jgi:hypothetical protein